VTRSVLSQNYAFIVLTERTGRRKELDPSRNTRLRLLVHRSRRWSVKEGMLSMMQDVLKDLSDLTHLCFTPRSNTTNEPEINLIMFPGDGTFTPYLDAKSTSSSDVFSPTNGRIFRLKFSSSSQRYFFWLQSKPTHPSGKANYFSERDLKLGAIVNDILQGDEVDIPAALSSTNRPDEDEDMGDAPDDELRRTSTGGAGPDATGGDFREEGEEAREGGADGARA
jgi:hypothetical protein